MVNEQLLDYIKSQLEEGVSKEDIKDTLLKNGWTDADVDEVFLSITTPAPEPVVPNSEVPSPQISSFSVSTPPSQVAGTMPQTELAGVGVLMGRTWSTYTNRFWILIGINILPFAFALLYGVFLGVSVIIDVPDSVVSIATFFLVLILIVLSLWSQLSILYAIKDNDDRIGVIESYRRGWKKLLSYWWIMILVTAVIMGGTILLIIPAILFAIWFSFAPCVLVTENIKGMDSLMKSKEYVRGKWWGVFGRVFVLLIPVLIFIVTVGVMLSSMGFKQDSTVYDLVMQVINLFIWPFVIAYSFSLYRSLKEARGSFVFKSEGKGKFIAVGILGFFIIPIMLFLLLSSVVLISLQTAREKGQDVIRKTEVGSLNIEILVYSDEKGTLPKSLNDLVAPGQDDSKIRDDITNELYEYRVGQGGTYSLCAIQNSGEKYCRGNMKSVEEIKDDTKDDLSRTETGVI